MGLAHLMLHKMTVHSSEANVPADHTPLVRTPRLGEDTSTQSVPMLGIRNKRSI